MSARTPRLPTNDGLTGRQREVLQLIARGRTNFKIATELGISLETAKFHVSEILARLGVESREEAAALWRHNRRLTSRLRALAPSFATKWVASTAAIVVVAASGLGVLALVNAGNDDTDRGGIATDASPTPTITPALAVTATKQLAASVTSTFTAIPGSVTPASAIASGTPTPTASSGNITPVVPPPPTPPTVAPAAGPYPFGTRTGISAVDAVIAAAESGDYAQLAALITWHKTNCFPPSPPPPYGAIVCPADDPTVTSYEVASVEYVDGNLFKKDEALARRIGSALVDLPADQRRVYAVLDLSNVNRPDFAATHRIIFASGESVSVGASGIVSFACGRTSLVCTATRTPAEQVSFSLGNLTPAYILPPLY